MGHYSDLYELEQEARAEQARIEREELASDIRIAMDAATKYPAVRQKLREAYLELMYGHEL